ncbi:glycosyltransferase, partial [bacterium]
MKLEDAKIVVVLPAYNAERTLERTLDEIPPEFRQHVILVDDASKDGTVALARKLGLTVFAHPQNRGYGGNQKTCYREALAM